jgi:hypothetical protein
VSDSVVRRFVMTGYCELATRLPLRTCRVERLLKLMAVNEKEKR